MRSRCNLCGFRVRGKYANHIKGNHHRSKLTPEQLKAEAEAPADTVVAAVNSN